jgi:hypothetical protein
MLRRLYRGRSSVRLCYPSHPAASRSTPWGGLLAAKRLPRLTYRGPNSSPTCGQRTLFTASSKNDTIYALSTGQGKAGIAVIRVSGPLCTEVMIYINSFSNLGLRIWLDLQGSLSIKSYPKASLR